MLPVALAVLLLAGLLTSIVRTRARPDATPPPRPAGGSVVGNEPRRYVATDGSDDGPGTVRRPWRTLAYAVHAAPSPAEIVIRAGIYHEQVEVPPDKRIALVAAPHAQVWLDGSSVVTGWVKRGRVWVHTGWRFDPSAHDPFGVVSPARPIAASPQQMWVDGVAQQQVQRRDQVRPGSFFYDRQGHSLVLGRDPVGHVARAASLIEALFLNNDPGSLVRGIGFRRYATPLARLGMVKGYGGDVTFDDDVFEQSPVAGLSINGPDVVVEHCVMSDNGQTGMQGQHADGVRIIDNVIGDNNTEGFAIGTEAGGVKIGQSRDVTVAGNRVVGNHGMGIWLDESVYQASIYANFVSANEANGIQFEISAGGLIAGNVITGSGQAGVDVVDSSYTQLWNNTLYDNRRGIQLQDGPRVASDASARGHDLRYPRPAEMTWVLEYDEVRNNILDAGAAGVGPLLDADDSARRDNATALHDSANSDAFVRLAAGRPTFMAAWCDYPRPLLVGRTLPEFVSVTGMERDGLWFDQPTDPLLPQAPGGDFAPAGGLTSGKGQPLPAEIARLLRLPATTSAPIGAPWPLPQVPG